MVLIFGLVANALAQDVAPTIAFSLENSSAKPGAKVKGKVTVTFQPGLHAYQNPPTESWMIPLSVSGRGVKVLSVDYPKGVKRAVGGAPDLAATYEGPVQIPVTIEAPSKAGEQTIELKVEYQQCDEENCFPPQSKTVSVKLSVAAAEVAKPPPATTVEAPKPPKPAPDGKQATEPTKAETPTPPIVDSPAEATPVEKPPIEVPPTETPAPVESEVPTVSERTPPLAVATEAPAGSPAPVPKESDWLTRVLEGDNLVVTLLAMLLVGLALCLTPCVYPMIPITVTFFGNQTAQNRAGKLGLGAMYTLGIAITYGAVGGTFAALGGAVGSLFTKPWFVILLAALMFALALTMFDVYEIGIPPFLSKHLRSRSGAVGALVMGLLMGFAAAPCAGALVSAAALKVAEKGSVMYGLLVFTAIGIGLGLPFMVLASVSAGAKALPRSGGWLAAVKAVMGLVVFAIGFDYLLKGLGVPGQSASAAYLWAGFFGLGALALLFLERRSGSSFAVQAIKGVSTLVLGGLMGFALAGASKPAHEELAWVAFDDSTYAQAKSSGKPILIDATANWCAECQVIERNVFQNPQARSLLSQAFLMKIDWSTGVDPAYKEKTAAMFGIKGLPHIVVQKPGGETSVVLASLHSVAELREALRGAGAR